MLNCVLLASANGEFEFFFVMTVLIGIGIARMLYKAHKEEELRKQDPAAYVRLKEIQNDAEQRKHESKMAGMKFGQVIAGWFFHRH